MVIFKYTFIKISLKKTYFETRAYHSINIYITKIYKLANKDEILGIIYIKKKLKFHKNYTKFKIYF